MSCLSAPAATAYLNLQSCADIGHRATYIDDLTSANVSVPTSDCAEVIQALAEAGIFRDGIGILCGTSAVASAGLMLGQNLPPELTATNDIDIILGDTAVSDSSALSIPAILRKIAPLKKVGKSTYRCASSTIDFLRYRQLSASTNTVFDVETCLIAEPDISFLARGPMKVVIPYGQGLDVVIPDPARLALHKLALAECPIRTRIQANKDMEQGRRLLSMLMENQPERIRTIWDELSSAQQALIWPGFLNYDDTAAFFGGCTRGQDKVRPVDFVDLSMR